MIRLQLVSALFLAVVACGKAKTEEAHPEIVAKITGVKTKACACLDAACQTVLLPEYRSVVSMIPPGGLNDADKAAVKALIAEIDKCASRFTDANGQPVPAGEHDAK